MQAGFIGCGNMGGTLASVAAKSGAARVYVCDHNAEKTARLRDECGASVATAAQIAGECELIFLGVKPQVMPRASAEIRDALRARAARHFAVVSMAAGLTAAAVAEMLDGCPVIRMMPNTPAAVGEGVLLYCPGAGVTAEDEAAFLALMAPAGLTVRIDEGKIDAASAVSGCGPAFVYLFAEALTDGGVRCGLPRETAKRFALQTLCGAARLALETGTDPAVLRGEVCSPAGSTIEGVAALEAGGVRASVIEAVTAAYRRTLELGR